MSKSAKQLQRTSFGPVDTFLSRCFVHGKYMSENNLKAPMTGLHTKPLPCLTTKDAFSLQVQMDGYNLQSTCILYYTIVHNISSQNIFLYDFPTFPHSCECLHQGNDEDSRRSVETLENHKEIYLARDIVYNSIIKYNVWT